MADINIAQKNIIQKLKRILEFCTPVKISQSIPYCLLRNWLFQGVALMHWSELVFRESIELLLFCSLLFLLLNWFGLLAAGIISFFIVHTLMWTFNGHFWALHISEKVRLVRNKPERILCYLENLNRRVNHADSISGCILFGSLARGQLHEFSDLDIIFTKERGFINLLVAYFLGIRERSLAFLCRVPIELYFYDPDIFYGKDKGEIPLLIKDIGNRWTKVVPSAVWLEKYPFDKMELFAHIKHE